MDLILLDKVEAKDLCHTLGSTQVLFKLCLGNNCRVSGMFMSNFSSCFSKKLIGCLEMK